MSASIRARIQTDPTTVHEVVHTEGGYVSRRWLRDPDMDRPLTREEAMEFIESVERCGGVVHGRRT